MLLKIPNVHYVCVQIGTLVSLQIRARRRAGSTYPAQTLLPTRCKRGRWGRSRQALLIVYVLQHHSVVSCCCIMYHMNKLEATKKCGTSRSDLQRQRSSFMMHPSGHPAARQQRCSHAPIPSRQPRSVCPSTWSLSRACYVRACCVQRYALCGLTISHL